MTDIIELLAPTMVLIALFAATLEYRRDREWQFWAFLCLFNLIITVWML